MPRWRRGRSLLFLLLLRRAFLLAAVSAAALFLLLHHQGPQPPKPSSSPPALAFSDDLSVEPPPAFAFLDELSVEPPPATEGSGEAAAGGGGGATCATVERMGEESAGEGSTEAPSLRVRELIRRHFLLYGAARVRALPAYEFCKQGFVLGKASEAGFGNEMYKILTAAALSVMLNRSLIIGQTRHTHLHSGIISFWTVHFLYQPFVYYWRNQAFMEEKSMCQNIW